MYKLYYNQIHDFKKWQINEFVEKSFPWNDPDYVLAGGSLLSLLDQNYPVNDFDIFILAKNEIHLKMKKQSIEKWFKEYLGYKEVFRCPKGSLTTYKLGGFKVQIININNSLFRSPKDLLDSFDFNLCKIALNVKTLYIDKKCIEDFKKKTLSVNCVTFPSSTINRLVKYKNKGFNILKACREISENIASNVIKGESMDFETVYVD